MREEGKPNSVVFLKYFALSFCVQLSGYVYFPLPRASAPVLLW